MSATPLSRLNITEAHYTRVNASCDTIVHSMPETFSGVGEDGKRPCKLKGCTERFVPKREKHKYCCRAHRYKRYNGLVRTRHEKAVKLKARIAELEAENARLKNLENNLN